MGYVSKGNTKIAEITIIRLIVMPVSRSLHCDDTPSRRKYQRRWQHHHLAGDTILALLHFHDILDMVQYPSSRCRQQAGMGLFHRKRKWRLCPCSAISSATTGVIGKDRPVYSQKRISKEDFTVTGTSTIRFEQPLGGDSIQRSYDDDDIAATADMRFWSRLQSIVVLATALASASPTMHAVHSETGVDATSSGLMTSAAEAAKQKLQQAAVLLASMPTCGVSGLGGFVAALNCC
jgi:hypothetical protein